MVNQPGKIVFGFLVRSRTKKHLGVFLYQLIFCHTTLGSPRPYLKEGLILHSVPFFSVLAFQKAQVNVNHFESSPFSHFLQVFPPKGLPRIIQNPNKPNRHKCHYGQSC